MPIRTRRKKAEPWKWSNSKHRESIEELDTYISQLNNKSEFLLVATDENGISIASKCLELLQKCFTEKCN